VYKSAGRPFVRSQNVGWGELKLDDVAYIDDTTHMTFPATEIRTGDVLLNITGASIGRSAVATPELAGGNVNQHVCEIRLKPQVMDPYYVNAFLLSKAGQDQIDAFQAGGNRQGLNFQQVGSIELPAPPIDLQRVIGAASRDTDSLTASLERLITKKQAIKQGMMQELLTGRTRLPGFSEPWRVARLGDVCKLWSGAPKTRVAGGRYWVVDMGSVTRDARLVVTRRTNERSDALHAGDLVMPKDDIGGGNIIGRTALIEHSGAYVLADHVYALTVSKGEVDPAYLNLAVNQYEVNQSLRSKASGSAQLGLGRRSVLDQAVRVPSGLDEQHTIAAFLSDCERELIVLHQRLDKARAIKQGMMQELLTGRTRLPVQEAVA